MKIQLISILLLIFTFSFSKSSYNIKDLKINKSIGGILELKEFKKIVLLTFQNKDSIIHKHILNFIKEIKQLDGMVSYGVENNDKIIPHQINKHEFQILYQFCEASKVKEFNGYIMFIIYDLTAIITKPVKKEKKCIKDEGIKKCQNVEVSQNISKSELEEIKYEFDSKLNDVIKIKLPKKNKSKFSQIFYDDYPLLKNIK